MTPRTRTTFRGLAILATLSGCAGTDMRMIGQACGQPIDLVLHDAKDRSEFSAEVTCPDGGSARISSTDSSVSAVLASQADLLNRLAGLITQLVISPVGATKSTSATSEASAALSQLIATTPRPPGPYEAAAARIDRAVQQGELP